MIHIGLLNNAVTAFLYKNPLGNSDTTLFPVFKPNRSQTAICLSTQIGQSEKSLPKKRNEFSGLSHVVMRRNA
jgi:hypothetical protein